MKKLFATAALGLCLTFGGGGWNGALAQKVGDPMPSLVGTTIAKRVPHMSGKAQSVHLHKYGVCSHNVVFLICDDKVVETPVGIYDIEKQILYLDNAPNDGIIDVIYQGPDGLPSVTSTLPDCK